MKGEVSTEAVYDRYGNILDDDVGCPLFKGGKKGENMKKLVVEMLVCCMFGGVCGWFVRSEWQKNQAREEWKSIESPVKIYVGEWNKKRLEVMRK